MGQDTADYSLRARRLLSKPVLWLVLAALILLAGIWILLDDPPTASVALKTAHIRYFTAMGGDFGWKLRAETGEILDCEKLVLLCQDDGQVALQTCHKTEEGGNRVVTATDAQGDWLLIGETDVIDAFVRFTMLDADTGERRKCRAVIKALKEDDQVRVAFQTWHMKEGRHRLVTSMGADWGLVLRAETNASETFEKFTMILLQ